MSRARRYSATPAGQQGQALVEFSLAFILFFGVVVALFDLGHGIYAYNGVSEAAREIARRTIVHPGIVLGQSQETQDTISVQRGLVPGMSAPPTFACVDGTGAPASHVPCQSGDYVQVTVTASFSPSSLLGLAGTINLSSSSSMQLP